MGRRCGFHIRRYSGRAPNAAPRPGAGDASWGTGSAPRSRTGGCTTPRFQFRDIGPVTKLCFTPRRGGLRNQLLMPGTRLMVDAPGWRPNCEPPGLQVQIASTKSMAPCLARDCDACHTIFGGPRPVEADAGRYLASLLRECGEMPAI